MANVRDIRRRIRSISNTQQLTRAMKLVSAAKLRRAQDNVLAARPFSEHMYTVLRSVAARVGTSRHPLLQRRPEERVEAVVISADRGLCGGFNTAILRRAQSWIDAHPDRQVDLTVVGRKGDEYFRRRRYPMRKRYQEILRQVGYEQAELIGRELIERYRDGVVDAVYVMYNEFRSAIQYRQVVLRLLPIVPEDLGGEQPQDYIYEPAPEKLLDQLLPRYCITLVHRALLESSASEHGARMTAMDSATNNAAELIESLTLQMNRVRQASITKEIIEVVSGAQVLG